MSLFPEREPVPGGVEETPEEISPLTIERKEVVTPMPSQFTAQVKSDSGQPLIQTPQTQPVTITLPKSQVVLAEEAKGSTDDASTWWGAFWIRMIKKAIYFGWSIITGQKNGQ